jgi:hypothetical protein
MANHCHMDTTGNACYRAIEKKMTASTRGYFRLLLRVSEPHASLVVEMVPHDPQTR